MEQKFTPGSFVRIKDPEEVRTNILSVHNDPAFARVWETYTLEMASICGGQGPFKVVRISGTPGSGGNLVTISSSTTGQEREYEIEPSILEQDDSKEEDEYHTDSLGFRTSGKNWDRGLNLI